MIELYNKDCHDGLNEVEDQSIQLILVDPPYGTTPLEWDITLNFKIMWELYLKKLKKDGCICIFGQEPFSSFVRMSNIELYRYDWYWVKERLTNVFQVSKRPGKVVETISVFHFNQCKYYSQKIEHKGKRVSNKVKGVMSETLSGNNKTKPFEYVDDGTRHPTQILRFNRDNNRNLIHPTQKPVDLLKYLISSYTEENDIVLDHCMGSGSTGIACKELNRNFIGYELDEDMFEKAKDRINNFFVKPVFF